MNGLLIGALAASFLSHYTNAPALQNIKSVEQVVDLTSLQQALDRDFKQIEASQGNTAQLNQALSGLINDLNQINGDFPVNQLGIRHLHPPRTTHKPKKINSVVGLSAGDNGVASSDLQIAAQTIQTISVPTLKEKLGMAPDSSTNIVLFSSPQSYGTALLNAGVPRSQVKKIVSETGGLTAGTDIWIPLYALQDQSELANVLTHELTHAIFNQKGIGDNLPVWINEGLAWQNGMAAKQQVSLSKTQREEDALNADLQQAVDQGVLVSLASDESAILSAPYNVEWEDYQAVQSLIQKYGTAKVDEFLKNVPTEGVNQSFLHAFGLPIKTFEQQFDKSLSASQNAQ
ncbi:hypothetical protein PP175_08915 [Aneurinibacillus sp. Ricciae_BoGa-3]|uniref:peptidase MA family metallohydrolase n=1 Tax=Aneurinibacillus sp. Ricciae_BoGa-3 TaxID=3022697 RepID=UPI0023401309|nr:hypothetical protein [Aneurinibacillus sp. Ricciae_BoGa-3]WCK56010.1 hypothetical protein PP175_08915 [Aneurinibacillus sp. Ricciae_BoGa-3]